MKGVYNMNVGGGATCIREVVNEDNKMTKSKWEPWGTPKQVAKGFAVTSRSQL